MTVHKMSSEWDLGSEIYQASLQILDRDALSKYVRNLIKKADGGDSKIMGPTLFCPNCKKLNVATGSIRSQTMMDYTFESKQGK